MYRFLLYSFIFHFFLIAIIIFASQFFMPKPKHIQIKLAVLPKNNDLKKIIPPPVLPSKLEKQKQDLKEAQKKAEEVKKLLSNILKEDIAEKAIEKPITKKELKSSKKVEKKESPKIDPIPVKDIKKETTQEQPKKIIQNNKKELPKQKEIIKDTKVENKQEIIPIPKLPEKKELPVKETPEDISPVFSDSKKNPYMNPIMPQEQEKVDNKNNPYANPVMPIQESISPSLPEEEAKEIIKPKRKEIDVSGLKDDNVGKEVNSIINDKSGISNNIMAKEAVYLTTEDKQALMNQMSQCLAFLGMIREKDETVTLLFEMNVDTRIKDINVIKNNQIIPKSKLSNLESRLLYLFNNPKCSKLILPKGKFSYWQKFTIKLNLKGLFN